MTNWYDIPGVTFSMAKMIWTCWKCRAQNHWRESKCEKCGAKRDYDND